MSEKNTKTLDCCVVRDLLPTYLEDITEPETTALVRAHLDGCPACRQREAAMHTQLPVEQAPRRSLNFLKRVRRTRLLASLVTAVLALLCMLFLYDQDFHYANTEAGRLAAVEDYVPAPEGFEYGIAPGTPLRVVAYAEQDGLLYLSYAAEDADRVHGILTLQRGILGKYRPLRSTQQPFPYTAGVYGINVDTDSRSGRQLFALTGDSCREIYAVTVEYHALANNSGTPRTLCKTYTIDEPNFLWLFDPEELLTELVGTDTDSLLFADKVALLDKNGNDVTAQYFDESVQQNWGGGTGSAETFLVYWFIALVAGLAVILIRYFLRKD